MTEHHHPYRYFLAGGKSLDAITRFVAEENGYNRRAALDHFKEQHDVKSVLDQGDGDLAFRFNAAAGPGWKPVLPARDGFFVPDTDTEQGRKISGELGDIQDRGDAQRRFAKWMGADRVDTMPGALRMHYLFDGTASACFEKLRGQYVIHVPVVSYADGVDWKTPPGATPIAVSAYYRMHEDAGNLPLRPTSKGHVPYNRGHGNGMEP